MARALPTLRDSCAPLIAAALTTILSLALPWTSGSSAAAGEAGDTRYAPGFCHTSFDLDGFPTTVCDAGTIIPGAATAPGGGDDGPSTATIALFAALSWTAVAVGVLRVRPLLVGTGAALFAAGILIIGVGDGTGHAMAWITALLLIVAAFLAGTVRRRRPIAF